MTKAGHGPRPPVSSMQGVVASAHPLASKAGADILRKGGNAFDAVVAVAAALNVVEPFMFSLAGMGFATMWVAAEKRVRVLDFVSRIPQSFPVDRFQKREQLERGPLSVGAPGNLAGWCALRDSYGRLPLMQLLEPAIGLAEEGFGVGRFGVQEITEHAPRLAANPDYGAPFRDNYPCHDAVNIGDIIRQPQLAATLRQIGSEGPAALYTGSLGKRVIDHLQAVGGTLTMDDLAEVAPVWREPIHASYRGLEVHTLPPPCEGFQFLLTLRILEGFDLASLGRNTVAHLDLVVRAIRLAASIRIENNLPQPDKLTELLSERFVETLRGRLRGGDGVEGPTEQWVHAAPGHEDPGHTTSFSIADQDGNMVCVTQSLGSAFGSGVVVSKTGVCLNNFLHWADVQIGSPNRAAPGGPLAICMAPSISTRDGIPELALGTPGSYGILQTQAQAMIQYADFGLGLQDAIDSPRGRLWDGKLIEFENRIDPDVISALRALGHDAKTSASAWTMRVGGMQAIRRDATKGLLTGAADPRRDGFVIGL